MTEEMIEFCMWLIGHDRETVLQMFEDFSRKVKKSIDKVK